MNTQTINEMEDDVDDTWMVDHEANLQSVVLEKIRDASTPGFRVLFDPDEADLAGAFVEDALSEQEARAGNIDLIDVQKSINPVDNDLSPLFHEHISHCLLHQLQHGLAPWQKLGPTKSFLPRNPVTGKRYKSINALYLMAQHQEDPRWMTYAQAMALEAQVRPGEIGTPIQYWVFQTEQPKTDATGCLVLDLADQPMIENVQLERPILFYTTVFNATQIDELPVLSTQPNIWNLADRVDRLLQVSGARIQLSDSNEAFYQPQTDCLHLPDKSQIPTLEAYAAMVVRALSHWTGHADRLNRDLMNPVGTKGDAQERLCLEIACMMLSDELGLEYTPQTFSSYVRLWLHLVQDDPLEIFRAATEAEQIKAYIQSFETKK